MSLPESFAMKWRSNTPNPDLIELHVLLDSLDFPSCFRHDFFWLKQNLKRDNKDKPNYERVMAILRKLS